MESKLATAFISTCFTLVSAHAASRPLSHEEQLMDTLFKNYNPSARPVLNSSHSVQVQIQFSLLNIKELDVRSQILTTTGLLILQWRDERLTWRPGDHHGLTEIIIEAGKLWRPEFAVINGAERIYEEYLQFRALVQHSGDVRWEPGGVFRTMCPIQITYYPFDSQVCELIYGAWAFHTSKMNLTNSDDIINTDSYGRNGEWEIYHTTVERKEFFYESSPHQRFSNVAFSVYLKRRHTFYIMNVILPSIMTSVLLLSIFFCTPGQKVQIGVVVLLSFRIFLLNVADNIPKTSDHVPLLGIYLTCTMTITTLSMVLTVFVLNIHHITERPVPPWVQKLMLCYIARCLCMSDLRLGRQKNGRKPEKKSLLRCGNTGYGARDLDADEKDSMIELCPLSQDGATVRSTHLVDSSPSHVKRSARSTEDTSKEDYSKEWKLIAEVCDRLFFWFFFFAILVSTIVLFHPLTQPTEVGNMKKI